MFWVITRNRSPSARSRRTGARWAALGGAAPQVLRRHKYQAHARSGLAEKNHIEHPSATHYRTFRDQFVEVLKEEGVEVVHPEHGPIHLDKGWWKVVRQREHEYGSEKGGTRWIVD